jgi:2-haloacid dehalogenase
VSALQIRDLVFDLGGVLVDWDPAYLYRDYLGMAADDVDDFLAEVCTASWHEQLDRGLSFAAGTRALAAQYPPMAARIQQWDSHWGRMFKGPLGDVDGLLAGLQAGGYRLHALSNYPSEKLDFLYANFSFMRCFHSVTISGLLGVAKPDVAIFAHVSALLGGRPGAFFDDRIENVDAASAAGFCAYHCPVDSELAAIVGQVTGRSLP